MRDEKEMGRTDKLNNNLNQNKIEMVANVQYNCSYYEFSLSHTHELLLHSSR